MKTVDEDFNRLVNEIRERSREIAPDYPNIKEDKEVWEHLWAITSSYEGCDLANKDLHEFITFLLSKLGWSNEKAVEEWRKLKGINK